MYNLSVINPFASEFVVIWADVNECILNKSWDKANNANTSIKEKEREVARSRKSKGKAWELIFVTRSRCWLFIERPGLLLLFAFFSA
ncbi:oxysterol-binding protein-related protein 4C-like protein isoform X1 [Tanacetum coccineum]